MPPCDILFFVDVTLTRNDQPCSPATVGEGARPYANADSNLTPFPHAHGHVDQLIAGYFRSGDTMSYSLMSDAAAAAAQAPLKQNLSIKIPESAREPSSDALYREGLQWLHGTGRDIDYPTAMLHFELAKTPEAYFCVALMHQRGLGTPKDPDSAARFYQLSGTPRANHNLAAINARRAGYLRTEPVERRRATHVPKAPPRDLAEKSRAAFAQAREYRAVDAAMNADLGKANRVLQEISAHQSSVITKLAATHLHLREIVERSGSPRGGDSPTVDDALSLLNQRRLPAHARYALFVQTLKTLGSGHLTAKIRDYHTLFGHQSYLAKSVDERTETNTLLANVRNLIVQQRSLPNL